MFCPVCGEKTLIIGTKSDCESVYRKRRCAECKHTFYTEEYESESNEYYNQMMREYQRRIKAERNRRKEEENASN